MRKNIFYSHVENNISLVNSFFNENHNDPLRQIFSETPEQQKTFDSITDPSQTYSKIN